MPTAGTMIFMNSPLGQQEARYKDQKHITLIKCLSQVKPCKSNQTKPDCGIFCLDASKMSVSGKMGGGRSPTDEGTVGDQRTLPIHDNQMQYRIPDSGENV